MHAWHAHELLKCEFKTGWNYVTQFIIGVRILVGMIKFKIS